MPLTLTAPPAAAEIGEREPTASLLPNCRSTVLGYDPVAIRVRPFDARQDVAAWDAFIAASANGNLFHTRRFLGYHPAGRFVDRSLVFEDDHGWIAIAAGCDQDDHGRRVWNAHRFSSHGGIVFRIDTDLGRCFAVTDALVGWLETAGYERVQMRMPPDPVCEQPMPAMLFTLDQCGFRVCASELTQYVDLSSGDDPAAHYHGSVQRAMRKACKAGFTVRESDRFDEFWPLLQATLGTRHDAKPTHTIDEIERISSTCPGEIKLLAAFDAADRMRAGTVVFRLNRRALHTFYFAQDYSTQEHRPLSLVKHELLTGARRDGYAIVNFGVCTANAGTLINFGLHRFKANFGARQAIRPTAVRELAASK